MTYTSRRQGLATALLKRTLECARACLCDGVIATTTSFKSRNALSKLGFAIVEEVRYDQIVGLDLVRLPIGEMTITMQCLDFWTHSLK